MVDFIYNNTLLVAVLFFAVFTGALVAATALGMRIGGRPHSDEEPTSPGAAAVDASVFGLFGLLIAFSFSGAAERFHARRTLILEESRAISTAWGNLDLLPEPAREDLRDRFRGYLDKKLATYSDIRDVESFERDLLALEKLGTEILAAAAAACRAESGKDFVELVIPAINEVNSLARARKAAIRTHPPLVIYGLLVALSLGVALLVGMAMISSSRKSRIHVIGFSLVVTATIYVTLDLETPRMGAIRVDSADALLLEIRRSMG